VHSKNQHEKAGLIGWQHLRKTIERSVEGRSQSLVAQNLVKQRGQGFFGLLGCELHRVPDGQAPSDGHCRRFDVFGKLRIEAFSSLSLRSALGRDRKPRPSRPCHRTRDRTREMKARSREEHGKRGC
jgi:hypothetical protein